VTYSEFLARKEMRHAATGVDVTLDPAETTHMHDWQRHIVQWALHRGRAAVFADTGLGKSRMQVAWAHHIADRSLIIAPLSVARQTIGEAAQIGVDVRYVRHPDDVQQGVSITNYEMAHHFDPVMFNAVALDESSILKCFTGSMRTALIRQWANTPYRSSWSATPAPNDVTELCNQAEFLGAMPRNEMLAAFFVHDDDGWRLKRHAVDPMFRWMTTWALAARKPSDVGGDDTAYELPPLRLHPEIVDVAIDTAGQLFSTDLGGVGGRHAVRKSTLDDRVARTIDLAAGDDQWIVWCGLNAEAEKVAANVAGAVNVEGSQTPDFKADTFQAFQDGEVRVLVTKPSIAGFGMNFQNAHRMVFTGLSDSWESYYQCVRRCWRFGQHHPVDVHIVVSRLEQQIVENVRRKELEVTAWTSRLIRHMQEVHAA
jgi:hypothetical protein